MILAAAQSGTVGLVVIGAVLLVGLGAAVLNLYHKVSDVKRDVDEIKVDIDDIKEGRV